MADRTRVFITVDVEASEERLSKGKLSPPVGYDQRVFGRFDNQKEELGIPFMMESLADAGLSATFFVEPLSAAHFGAEGLRSVCSSILDRGHDVQLHLHPVLRVPNYQSLSLPRVNDDIGSYCEEEQVSMLEEAALRLVEWGGVSRDKLVGYRAGNFGASEVTWRAMARAGLRISSNLNAAYLVGPEEEGCHIRLERNPTALFPTDAPGVWELPVSTFREASGALRHLQISAVSSGELEHALREGRRLGIPDMTVVTHPFEYFLVDDTRRRLGHKNRVNRHRFRALLRFLSKNSRDFEVTTLLALSKALPERPPPMCFALPTGDRLLRARRLLGQAIKRLAGKTRLG